MPIGERQDRHQRRAGMQQEDDAHQRDDEALLEQLAPQVLDRTLDQVAPVVHRRDDDARRQRRSGSRASFALTL